MNLKAYFYLGRFHSPFGTFLLMLPSLWGVALNLNLATKAGYPLDNSAWYYYLIFIVGSFFMRAWGCVINDIFDKNIDNKVLRTKNRPLASGDLSVKEAIFFLVILSIIPLIILYQLSPFAKFVAILSIPLVLIYPLTKRFFKAPQLVLGITFNWGILLSCAIIFDEINYQSWLLYLASILWCIAYDSIYAYQDMQYDKALKLNSTAILIGDKITIVLPTLYVSMAVLSLILGYLLHTSFYYYIIQILGYSYIVYKFYRLDYNNPQECFVFFKNNVLFATIVWLSFLVM